MTVQVNPATIPFTPEVEILKDDSWKLGPYIVSPKPSESLVGHVYLRFEREGLLDRMFTQGKPSLSWFLDWCGKADLLVCSEEIENGRAELRGMGWLTEVQDVAGVFRKAEAGICFFRRQSAVTIFGKLMMAWAFANLDLMVIYGTVPASNRAAVMYAQRMGMKLSGVLPSYTLWKGKPCAACVFAITKEDWACSPESTRSPAQL